MSRNQSRKGGSKRFRSDEWSADTREPDNLYNAAFERYYRGHLIPEESWETFLSCLRTSLPMSLRFNLSSPQLEKIATYVTVALAEVFDTKKVIFFPQQMAIQCGVSRGDMKRKETFKELKKMVSAMNEGGYLTRQETVSMLPPLLLQVKPGMRVLDMCAAPGSKTSQLLEMLLGDGEHGVVVANDVNASRLDVLHHQTNRASGAHPHLIITNSDATHFPLMPSGMRFDRVLCDVMCSGDGTLRKSLDMWAQWNTLRGASLHSAQVRVLLRGMALCAKDGIVVYSTCSLNPIEDEAVVSASLAQVKGRFELIDPEPLLPGLIGTPGRTSWTITTRDLSTELSTYEDAKRFEEAQTERKVFRHMPSMFANEELLKQQHIGRSRRILPHAQDTGGFFVAAFRCLEEVPDVPSECANFEERAAETPLKPISASLWASVQRALQLPDTFPFHRLLARKEDAQHQKIYLANEDTIALSRQLGGRVMHVGSKIFESFAKYSNDKLRFSTDGVADLVPLLPSHFIIAVSPSLLLSFAGETPMSYAAFDAAVGCDVAKLPPSLVLTFTWDVVGPIYVVAERSGKLGKMVAHVADWQVAICKLALGQPLVEIKESGVEEEAAVTADGSASVEEA